MKKRKKNASTHEENDVRKTHKKHIFIHEYICIYPPGICINIYTYTVSREYIVTMLYSRVQLSNFIIR